MTFISDNWRIVGARWALASDLGLPYWSEPNSEQPHPFAHWLERFIRVTAAPPESPADVSGLLANASCGLASSEGSATDIRLQSHGTGSGQSAKFAVCTAGELPKQLERMRDSGIAASTYIFLLMVSTHDPWSSESTEVLSRTLGLDMPTPPVDGIPIPQFTGIGADPESNHVAAAVCLRKRDTSKQVAVLMPHWESYGFANSCLRHIRKNSADSIHTHTYILDDGSRDGSLERLEAEAASCTDVSIIRCQRENSGIADVGLLLDEGIALVNEEFICFIDADLFPLNSGWLAFPLWILDKYLCSSVGTDTGLSLSYQGRVRGQHWAEPNPGYPFVPGLSAPGSFSITNNFFRVMRTSLAREASEQVGFRRRPRQARNAAWVISRTRARIGAALGLGSRDLVEKGPYIQVDADNGVAAGHWLDVNRLGPKYNIPISSCAGFTTSDGAFGQNLCGLALHFALSTRALSNERREVADAGADWSSWAETLVRGENADLILEELERASRENSLKASECQSAWADFREDERLFQAGAEPLPALLSPNA